MKYLIKNMISERCIISVKGILKEIDQTYNSVTLGEIDIESNASEIQVKKLKYSLKNSGFELLQDKKSMLVDKIASAVIQMIHFENLPQGSSYSAYLEKKLHYNYTYLARIFSAIRGLTIERFIIIHKIERAKELLAHGKLSLTEISHLLFYSSPAHLSNQFKIITGLTPAVYKKNKDLNRKNLEDF